MGILNRKANEKLNFLVSVYTNALKGYWETEYDGFLRKRVAINNLHFLKELNISYFLKNRFFARNYDLVFEYEVPAIFGEQMEFGFRYLGKTSIKNAEFFIANETQEATHILKKLNNPLIIDRLVKLELLDFKLEYSNKDEKWHVRADSLIGSTTWNLIPPIFQIIKPTEKECVLMIELFELISDAIRNDT